MKKTLSFIIVALSIFSSPLFAGPTISISVRNTHVYGSAVFANPAGVAGLIDGAPFQTFCIEAKEIIEDGGIYDVFTNTEALNGGEDVGSDPLDPKTAFLYDAFLDGKLSEYGYSYGKGHQGIKSTRALQRVIWYLEGEKGKNWRLGSLEDRLYNAAMNSGWTDIGNIRIINMYEDGQMRQDQLARIIVPAPAAVLLSGIGVLLVGWMRSRRMF